MNRIFVYGTLKQGYPNAHVMKGRRVPGRFVTVAPWSLYLVGARHTPWLVADDGHGVQVEGELYEVGDEHMPALDALEDVGVPLGYRRERIDVQAIEGDRPGEAMRVQVYLQDLAHLDGRKLEQGPLSSYTLAQSRLYVRDL